MKKICKMLLTIVLPLLTVVPGWGAEAELTRTQQLWINSYNAEKSGDYAQAIEYTTRIIEESGALYLAVLRMGWLHYLNQDYVTSLAYYRQTSALSPGAVTPLNGQVNCLVAMKRAGEAISVAKSILTIDPMNYHANAHLGDLYYGQGDFHLAATYYLKLSRLFPEDTALANSLAWCYMKQGKPTEARTIFNNVLVVSPNDISAKKGLELSKAAPTRSEISIRTLLGFSR